LPVHLEWVHTPSDQDEIDLKKLLQDAPQDWGWSSSQESISSWIEQIKQSGNQIAAGRFNDRLITIAVITPAQQPKAFLINQLLVRAVTRERGVAKQLLVRLTQWADQEGFSLIVHDNEHAYRTLLEFGFLYDRPNWKRLK